MLSHLLLMAAAAALTLLSSAFFVNGIEWLSFRLRLGPAGTGSVLAALGGTLPEALVTLLAAVSGSAGISTGTALGSAALLATLGFALVALAAGSRFRSSGHPGTGGIAGPAGGSGVAAAPTSGIRRNLAWFMTLFAAALALSFVPARWPRLVAAPLFALAWLAFALANWDRQPEPPGRHVPNRPAERLYISPRRVPRITTVLVQTLLSCAGLAVGADMLVAQLENLSAAWQLPALVVSLAIAPLATELPEMATATLWAWRGRLDLALQNVSGALVGSATLPMAVALAFSPWRLAAASGFAAAITLLGAITVWSAAGASLRVRRLSALGLLFAVYLLALLV